MKLLRASALLVCAFGFAVACGQAAQDSGEGSSSTTPAEEASSADAVVDKAADAMGDKATDAMGDAAAAVTGPIELTVAVDGMT